jgi:hypothetical protein
MLPLTTFKHRHSGNEEGGAGEMVGRQAEKGRGDMEAELGTGRQGWEAVVEG